MPNAAGNDAYQMSLKCQAAHVMITKDEISMIAAKLLGTLDNVIKQTVRARCTYKKRQDHPIRKC